MLNPDKQWIEDYLTLLSEVFGPELDMVDSESLADLPAELMRKVSESAWLCEVGEA